MAYFPFDGVLLDDPRDPIPGAIAIQLHHRIEREQAVRDRRTPLNARAIRDRASACQALLGQGLLPEQLQALERHGLAPGDSKDVRSFSSLTKHFQDYLHAVDVAGYIEPSKALWLAVDREISGARGFWIERHMLDGPLEADIRDLAPPRLRALCALPALGTIRFRLATRKGSGVCGLFARHEPHLVRQLLPTLETLAVERGIDHFELDAPEGWASNPWGEALDGLFEGPLQLRAESSSRLQRALLPTEAAVWRAALEQICSWIDLGIPASEITLIHPEPAGLGNLLRPLLAAEGLPLRKHTNRSLKQSAVWGSLWALIAGLRDCDPAMLAAGLAASPQPSPLGRSLRALAKALDESDQAGELALDHAYESLRTDEKAWLKERWSFIRSLAGKTQPLSMWLLDVESLASRLELVTESTLFYPALGLLTECWVGDDTPLAFAPMADGLESALDLMCAPETGPDCGLNLISPSDLASTWKGSAATVILDLGEGCWPSAPNAIPELDWLRLRALNTALRAQAADGGGAVDFSPALQCFPLPQAEEGETLPRAFHREAYAFNRALSLTKTHLVALSAQRDSAGQIRPQGPFWQALEGAGTWQPALDRAASHLRWRWEAAESGALTLDRQKSMRAAPSDPETALARTGPERDRIPGIWNFGDFETSPASPTLLEGLARCPFRVHAQRHLKLDSWQAGDAHALHLGGLLHKLMEVLLQGLDGSKHWPSKFLELYGINEINPTDLQGLLRKRWETVAATWLKELPGLSETGAKRLCLSVEDAFPSLAAILAKDLAQNAPDRDESEILSFAPEATWWRELLGLEIRLPPRPIDLPHGGKLWLQGTVDRLEKWVSPAATFLRIVDYKTSSRGTLRDYQKDEGLFGAHLQLPLYQIMIEAEYGLPACAILLSLKEEGKAIPMMLAPGDEAGRARLLCNIQSLVDRARRGDFPANPGEHCTTCALSAFCGRPVDVECPEAEVEA